MLHRSNSDFFLASSSTAPGRSSFYSRCHCEEGVLCPTKQSPRKKNLTVLSVISKRAFFARPKRSLAISLRQRDPIIMSCHCEEGVLCPTKQSPRQTSLTLPGVMIRNRWQPVFLLLLLGVFLLLSTLVASALPAAQTAAQGETIFNQKCTGCHTIGKGHLVGPDLKDVTLRRNQDWLVQFIGGPDKMIAANDPIATQLLAENNNVQMPNLGLSQAEIMALLAYLETQSGAAAPTAAPAANTAPQSQPAPMGNPLRGQALFIGQQALANGGPACISCHSVVNVGALAGGTLGPDLTHVIQRYGGQAGLASTLASLPFPTMQGIFATRQLSPAEQADLLAFFTQADQQPVQTSPALTWVFLGIAAAGTLFLLGTMLFSWPRQRQSLSERMRKGTWRQA